MYASKQGQLGLEWVQRRWVLALEALPKALPPAGRPTPGAVLRQGLPPLPGCAPRAAGAIPAYFLRVSVGASTAHRR